MTSLEELCRTKDETARTIAKNLAELDILTDRDLLLANEAVLKRCNITKHVPERLGYF